MSLGLDDGESRLRAFLLGWLHAVVHRDAHIARNGVDRGISGGDRRKHGTVGLYLLIFVARHHKEFSESYNKIENSVMSREDTGQLHRVEPKPVSKTLTTIVAPGILAFIAAMAWLAN